MTKVRLIIAEDESLVRMNLRETLVDLGYLVVGEARDGLSAVNLARALRPDLVVMDIKMPELSGIEAAQLLAKERIAPVLLVTAYADRDFVARAQAAGVAGYLVKPYRAGSLQPAIEMAMARFGEIRARYEQLETTKTQLETHKLVERAKGLLRKTHGLSEHEASHRIEQLAANTERPIKAVAEAVLLAGALQR